MRILIFFLSAFLALCALPASANIGDSDSNLLIQMYSPPNKFHLFERHDFKNLSYDSDKTLRVCDTQNSHAVGLNVTHDGTTSMVKPGACAVFTARNFKISPAGPVNQDYDLTGTIEKAKG